MREWTEVERWLSSWGLPAQSWKLEVTSQNPCKKSSILNTPVTSALNGAETGGSLEHAGFWWGRENTSPRFRERPCLKELGREWERTTFGALFWPLMYTPRHMHPYYIHTHSNTFRCVYVNTPTCAGAHTHTFFYKEKRFLYHDKSYAWITLSLYISFVRYFVIATRQKTNTRSIQYPTFQNNGIASRPWHF